MEGKVILTEGERNRFWKYLIECAESDEALAGQLSKLPSATTQAVENRLRAEATAGRLLAAKLVATSSN